MNKAQLDEVEAIEARLPYVTILAKESSKALEARLGLDNGFVTFFVESQTEACFVIAERRPDLLLIADDTERGDLPSQIASIRGVSRTEYLPVVVWGDEKNLDLATMVTGGHIDGMFSRQCRPAKAAAFLRAILRRWRPTSLSGRLEFSLLTLNEDQRRVEWNGESLHLSPTEFRFLAALVDEPSHFLSRSELLRRVWGWNVSPSRKCDQLVESLRKLLRPLEADDLIETVHGIGYRLKTEKPDLCKSRLPSTKQITHRT